MSEKLKDALHEATKEKKNSKMLPELHSLDDQIEDFIQKLEKKIDGVKDNPIFVQRAFQLLANMSKEYSEFIAALRAIVNAIDRKGMTLPKENPIGKVRDVNARQKDPEDEVNPPPEEGNPQDEDFQPKGVKEALTLEPKKCKKNKNIREALDEAKDYKMIFYDSNDKKIDVIETKASSSADAFEQAKNKKPSKAKMVDLVVDKRSIGKYDLSKKGLS